LSPLFLVVSMPPKPGLPFAPRVGEGSLSLCAGARPRGVHVSPSATGVEPRPSLDGVVDVVAILVGDGFGVDCRRGDGEAGLSGRRNGDARGEPYDNGEGLYDA
jgi:hypothetical protein